VRELKHVIARALVLSPNGVIDDSVVHDALAMSGAAGFTTAVRLAGREEEELRRALERCDWDIYAAGQVLGVSAKTVYRRIERYGLEIPRKWQRRSRRGGAKGVPAVPAERPGPCGGFTVNSPALG
jgi:two-component system response regulator HydG